MSDFKLLDCLDNSDQTWAGGWNLASMRKPENGRRVLCVVKRRGGKNDLCFGKYYDNYLGRPKWVTELPGKPQNVIMWIGLPHYPERSV